MNGGVVTVDGEVQYNVGNNVVISGNQYINITCDESVFVEGDVAGSVKCENIGGSLTGGSDINCGHVGGSVNAQGKVNCSHVGGSVRGS